MYDQVAQCFALRRWLNGLLIYRHGLRVSEASAFAGTIST